MKSNIKYYNRDNERSDRPENKVSVSMLEGYR